MKNGYLLDTNVLSELMRPSPASAVMAWFRERIDRPMYTSSITEGEILLGIALLPEGKRRDALANAAQQLFGEDFAARRLPFDSDAAFHYAIVRASRRRQGEPVTTEDAQIAAIALAHELAVVTRNTKDFLHIPSLALSNPWQQGA